MSKDDKRKSSLASRPDFDWAVAQTKTLLESRGLRWVLSGNVLISPRLDEEQVVRTVGQKNNEHRNKFERILSAEIVPAVNDAVTGGIHFRSLFQAPQDLAEDEVEEQRERSQEVAETFVTDALKQRVLVRTTCKGTVFEDLRWDVSVKKYDLANGKLSDLHYATLELTFGTLNRDETPFALFQPMTREARTFNLHLGDLTEFIKDLEDLKRNLEKIAGGEHGTKS